MHLNLEDIARRKKSTIADVTYIVEQARRSMVPRADRISVLENGVNHSLYITREGVGPINREFGNFYMLSFRIDDKWAKYSVMVMSKLSADFRPVFQNPDSLLLRVDSGCETGQVFGDRTCECRQQLEEGLKHIARVGEGLLISIPRQDGRGLGLPFKLATLRLQEELGLDTVEAAKLLDPGGSRDTRSYAGIIGILKFMGVPEQAGIKLASNNPKKLVVFHENGFTNAGLTPIVVEPTDLTRRHLLAKQRDLGHLNLVGEVKRDGEDG